MRRNTTVKADTNAPKITEILANFVANHPSGGWNKEVDHEAHRTFLNWVACAIGASNHETTNIAIDATNILAPSEQAAILGRAERTDMTSAAFINGISSHTFDYDDTHLKTIIHPAGPVASAVLALAENIKATGREVIDALVLGIDVSCRVGNMIYPEHYDVGWHITGSTGSLGAAAACARLLKLDSKKTQMALGIAASQPVGFREQFGTMTKPLHPGAAAEVGLMAAFLAERGFTASPYAIEAPRGYAQVVSNKVDWDEITNELGERFEISFNTYKPFACGIVIHPSIDGCVRLRNRHNLKPEDIEKVELRVHSLVLELTGKKEPKSGLEGKFSIYHSCAAGLIFGQAGETEYADDIVNRADVVALRERVVAVVDDSIHEASADVTVYDREGNKYHEFVEHAIGSIENPMTDDDLNKKVDLLVEPILGDKKLLQIKNICWSMAEQDDVKQLIKVATQ